ncbi:hypothetical protein GGR53DRAFT_521227 [Hypoxylon sp. FL1150]|nr:hypothetical protein GGR53DRAFT_521227 [Hypoxylon sp. FL1150]
MIRIISAVALAMLSASTVFADDAPECSLTQKCPEETPCCSQYGQCGVGAYCLGGCDPRMSFSLDACVPEPVCASKTMKMDSTDNIVGVSKYLGDPTKADWVAQGTPLAYSGNVILTMPPNSAGTVLASTIYMWYGNVKAKIKTSRDAGVVTAFILFSDVKDEIDFEWVGTELDIAQTNYYFQGIPDYTHSTNITGLSNTNEEWHTYEIRWTPDRIEWYVDDKLGRTQEKSTTWNETANQWNFPQTPSRVQLSIWPGGDPTKNAPGTIEWAGGEIDWDSDDIKKDGYYYATIGEVTIDCYQTDKAPGTNSGKSYVYKDARGTNDTVDDGDANTVLKSLVATGLDMDKDTNSASISQQVIPGLSGAGPGTSGNAAGGDDSSSGSGTNDNGVTGTGSSGAACTQGFSQVCGSSDGDSQSEAGRQERMLGASTFAALVAVGVMLWL